MMARGQRMLRFIVCRGRQLSAESIAAGLQTSCGLQISLRTVRRELHGMGFHGRAATPEPCKACCHWTLKQWKCIIWSNESHLDEDQI